MPHSYLYDAEGRICAVQVPPAIVRTPSGMTQYLYDAEGNRIGKGTITQWSCDSDTNNFSLTNEYVLGQNGEQITELDGNGNWLHTHAYAGGQIVATFDSLGRHYQLADWLGTRRVQADPHGKIEMTFQSLPFGELVPDNTTQALGATEHHFTGKERDAESGLDNFGARYYGSSMGRFMSPDYSDDQDPVPFANFSNPQSMNLYSYALNNPTSNSDDSGHDVNVCTNDSSGNQQCTLLSNEQYSAATQGNGSLNVPSLNSVGMNGSGNITDGSGNTVGTASYVSNGGFDYYGNQSFYNQLSNTSQVVKAGTALYAGAYAGVAGGLFAYAGATGALGGGVISLNITGVAQASALALPAGGKVAQIMARAGPEFRGDPAKLLSYLKDLVSQAVSAGTYVQTGVGTMYRAGSDYIVVNGGVITSYVKNADPSWGRPLTYAAAGGK